LVGVVVGWLKGKFGWKVCELWWSGGVKKMMNDEFGKIIYHSIPLHARSKSKLIFKVLDTLKMCYGAILAKI
jgi:hypothetical protein